ncbi:MAG: DUF952 domain-containing protein [Rhodovibrionaceae bacterium]
MAEAIYHVCSKAAWKQAERTGVYAGSDDDIRDGFLHFSTGDQVVESVEKHRAGQKGLVIVACDPDALYPQLRWEAARGGKLFPHFYGELKIEKALFVKDLPLGEDGRHLFPELEHAGDLPEGGSLEDDRDG